nr:reverse transcriptase domain-containing protein [Tanacetum cinerariifolium]
YLISEDLEEDPTEEEPLEEPNEEGKVDVVAEDLSRKEQVKPKCVRAMARTIQFEVKRIILVVQSEAFKQENEPAERLHGLDQ